MKSFFQGRKWIKTGLLFGFLMFLIIGIVFAFLQGKILSLQYLVVNFVVMMIGGLIYGLLMKSYFLLTDKK